MSHHVLGIVLQRAVIAFSLTEDRCRSKLQLHHIAFNIVRKYHSQTLVVAAGAGLALAGTLDVLRAGSAVGALRRLHACVGLVAIGRGAARRDYFSLVISACVEGAGYLGGSLHNHHVEIALLDLGNFLAVRDQTEHASLGGDAFALRARTTSQRLGDSRHFGLTCEGGDGSRAAKHGNSV